MTTELIHSIFEGERRNLKIVLVGFMGTGKTEVGKILAERRGMLFIDTDQEIERESGMTIPEIFSAKGEAYFRKLESQVLERALSSPDKLVVAGGGGIVISDYNRRIIKEQGNPVLLTASPELIMERVRDSDRPLLQRDNPLEAIKRLLKRRSPYYEQFNIRVETDFKEPEEIANEIMKVIK
ncbi:MAG TPA: shikimate kinase [Halanaerobiales bacterium]|nr:shikimate kinase [Halanaerobiales bacterium]